jgi:hypothetical protein
MAMKPANLRIQDPPCARIGHGRKCASGAIDPFRTPARHGLARTQTKVGGISFALSDPVTRESMRIDGLKAGLLDFR